MTRRAARSDANQTEIVRTLRAMGVRVAVTSGLGGGFPDLVLRYAGRWQPVEIKDGAKPASGRKLTADEVTWWQRMGCEPVIIETVDDCERVARWMVNNGRRGGEAVP